MPAFADETDLVVQVHSNQPAEEFLVEVLKSENEAEQMAPRRILIYHTHTYEAYQQDEKDAYGQSFSVVVGSSLNKNQDYYAGAGLAFDENKTIVTFTDSLGQVIREENI